MDAHLENHLPLITGRLVFAPRALLPPPTITPRMVFPEIELDTREESPIPETRRAWTPLRRADTPSRITVPKKVVVIDRPSTPPQNKVEYVTSGSDDDMYIDDEDNDDQNNDDGVPATDLIRKPKGDVSRPGRGGYTLSEALGWNQKTYDAVLLAITRLAKERLEPAESYRGQSKKKIAQVVEMARKEFGFLKDYEKDWPIHDILKTYLKNTSQTARNAKGKSTAEKIDKIVNGSSVSAGKSKA